MMVKGSKIPSRQFRVIDQKDNHGTYGENEESDRYHGQDASPDLPSRNKDQCEQSHDGKAKNANCKANSYAASCPRTFPAPQVSSAVASESNIPPRDPSATTMMNTVSQTVG